ncbi:hypothetical protein E2C01_012091 [Portunus trituberculatus]|uniref:Uncharacterized protein n=1 Tax=Portunus trituberculatus TaxID=210409 RepID=A0A5B7DCK3_PORTR|nr:hypothetical protein [Portunus trituberculatus]
MLQSLTFNFAFPATSRCVSLLCVPSVLKYRPTCNSHTPSTLTAASILGNTLTTDTGRAAPDL